MKDQEGDVRIYVACLASYNNGILHGAWINANQDEDDIWDAIKYMLEASPIENAEEYAIHDYEGFQGAPIAEYQSIKTVCEIAAFIDEHDILGANLLSHFHDLEYCKTALEDHYYGEYKSVEDFARELTEQSGNIPANLEFYIDYERMGRDMEINDVFTIETGFEEVHIFWNF